MGSDPQSHLEAQNLLLLDDGRRVTPAVWEKAERYRIQLEGELKSFGLRIADLERQLKSAEEQNAKLDALFNPKGPGVLVDGLVAARDQQPYIQLAFEGKLAQLSMAQARNLVQNISTMCARTEADAMIFDFFRQHDLPKGAATAMMIQFRDFRHKLDSERVESTEG